MLISLIRIIKSGWRDFRRNGGLSSATIFIMVLTISLATSLFLFHKVSGVLTEIIDQKVDMYVYFNQELSSDDILELQSGLSEMPGIKSMEYVSQQEALENFIYRHRDDENLMQSLEELGKNPLLSSLNIQAWEASQYATISNYLLRSPFDSLIAKIDYQQKKPVIERLESVSSGINRAGILSSIVLALVAVLVAFNTIRLAIYNSREEIETMRLVGASNGFIRGPFIVQGLIVGLIASLLTLLLFWAGLYFVSSSSEILLSGFSIFDYFTQNLLLIFFIQLAAGLGLGIISSWLAIRRYLRV